jgi:L-aspartate oxidase
MSPNAQKRPFRPCFKSKLRPKRERRPSKLGPAPDNIIETEGALILGGGVAGLFTALKLAPMPSLVITGARPGHAGSSVWAQGGVAAALGPGDSWERHLEDTLAAGAGLCEPAVTEILVREGPKRVEDLIALDTPFDRDSNGNLALGLEAAHGRARIVHVEGDRAGAAITQRLVAASEARPSIAIMDGLHAIELAMQNGRVVGLFARQGAGSDGRLTLFRGRAVVFATGGIGALYAVTTNPPEARGEGLGMAARAGAMIADPEFVQFHPTAIDVERDPAPLATEALRGEGAVLINEMGVRFMRAVHPEADLAPRDIVARAIHREIARGGRAFLDCRKLAGRFAPHFSTIYAAATTAGIDPTRDLLPVAPAAHYHMGGIATDAVGRSSLEGLWACGECASSGVHGANRLASNSLLEAMVLGARVAEDIRNQFLPKTSRRASPSRETGNAVPVPPPPRLRKQMSLNAGIERDADRLRMALKNIQAIEHAGGATTSLLNMTAAAKLIAAAALKREESRGAHFRVDHPHTKAIAERTFLTLADAEQVAKQVENEIEPSVKTHA